MNDLNTKEKDTFLQTYAWARSWEDLPWAHHKPMLFLAEICAGRPPGTALDIGCGAGIDSVYLAQQGWDVTSLDFMPKALEYTQERASEAGVSVTPVVADITSWEPPKKFDLVIDHGLFHNMDPVRFPVYRECIMNALADEGDFVLLHWHPLFPDQPQGKVGPRRVARDHIRAFYAPDLQEHFFAAEEFEDLPEMVGGGMRQAYYWFRHNQSILHPAELIGQIEATLTRNGFDVAGCVDVSEPVVDDALLSLIVGPGRLGLSHRPPDPGEAGGVIKNIAEQAGLDGPYVENLLRVFASVPHGNICIANARCAECDVQFCKRKRYR